MLNQNTQVAVLSAIQLVVDKILEQVKSGEESWEISLPYEITLGHNPSTRRYIVRTDPDESEAFVEGSLVKTIAYVVSLMT